MRLWRLWTLIPAEKRSFLLFIVLNTEIYTADQYWNLQRENLRNENWYRIPSQHNGRAENAPWYLQFPRREKDPEDNWKYYYKIRLAIEFLYLIHRTYLSQTIQLKKKHENLNKLPTTRTMDWKPKLAEKLMKALWNNKRLQRGETNC